MNIYRDSDTLPQFDNAVATMGSFDGLHSGHMELLRRVQKLAQERGGQSVVLTFDPHPRYVLGTGDKMHLITTLEEKLWLLERAGIDNVVVLKFTEDFSRLSPQEFISYIADMGIGCMVVGYNHRFGHKKEGDYNYLESRSRMELYMVEQQQLSQSKISSTIIRQAINLGMMSKAKALLSHPYIIMGVVTADGMVSSVDEKKLLPPEGHYSARVGDRETTLIIGPSRKLSLPAAAVPQGKVLIELI